MATKYTVVTGPLESGDSRKTVSKKQAAITFGEGLNESFRVVTDSGTVVHEATVDIPVEEPTAPEAPVEEPTAPEAPAGQVFYEQVDLPGNYSIVTAPGALQIAEAAGVPAKSETKSGSLTRTVHFGGDDMDKAQAVAALVKETETAALEDLRLWQKKDIERRRGLTDMQRFLEHRQHISSYFAKVAKKVKKAGL